MRILLLAHAFNSLTQRLYVELAQAGHSLSVEFDIDDGVTREAVALFRPHLILAPYLRRRIPEDIWRHQLCWVVHPGIVGDRGPSALDWAVLEGERQWGVTVLEAQAELDGGPIWAERSFPMRPASKSSLYRREVTEAAVQAVFEALERLPAYRAGRWRPTPLAEYRPTPRGRWRPLIRQADRAPDWGRDGTELLLRKLASADGQPGLADTLWGRACRLFDAQPFPAQGPPGALLGRCGQGIVRATRDGAIRIGQVRLPDAPLPIKLPATMAFPQAADLPELAGEPWPIRYREHGAVGLLAFDFYNGAMGSEACAALRAAYLEALARPTRVLVLLGGEEFFSNGMDLNLIEAAASPADESWRNIQAMDDLCQAILETTSHLTVAVLRGNAGAGGVFLALTADAVWARRGVVLNPHYRNMGNLYGSEYWTYVLPKRVGQEAAQRILEQRLPMGAKAALRAGLIDALLPDEPQALLDEVLARARELAVSPRFETLLTAKHTRRSADEAVRPLAEYRAQELERMRRAFYGFDVSYHVARHRFVLKTPHAWTPRHLARHRDLDWRMPED